MRELVIGTKYCEQCDLCLEKLEKVTCRIRYFWVILKSRKFYQLLLRGKVWGIYATNTKLWNHSLHKALLLIDFPQLQFLKQELIHLYIVDSHVLHFPWHFIPTIGTLVQYLFSWRDEQMNSNYICTKLVLSKVYYTEIILVYWEPIKVHICILETSKHWGSNTIICHFQGSKL